MHTNVKLQINKMLFQRLNNKRSKSYDDTMIIDHTVYIIQQYKKTNRLSMADVKSSNELNGVPSPHRPSLVM